MQHFPKVLATLVDGAPCDKMDSGIVSQQLLDDAVVPGSGLLMMQSLQARL
jgi:hypothetical protein